MIIRCNNQSQPKDTKMKVFLGGTVNGSNWRDLMIPRLKIDYFNPVVPDWNDEAWQRELKERKHCDYVLYILTPRMEGYYSIAEVIDDSYKRPDRCIYCFVAEDGDRKFDDDQIASCEYTGKCVRENGGTWLKSIDEVVDLLNSAEKNIKSKIAQKQDYNNVFISYGRRHSLTFARRLFKSLASKGLTAWFDMNDIPLGVDFQEQIDEGIENADNFIYVISPHSVKSEFCLREVLLAIKYGKRIIPILHVEPSDCWDKMHPVIEKLNWVYMREKNDDAIPPTDWVQIDPYEQKFNDLCTLINFLKEPIRLHTVFLHLALEWDRKQRVTERLLVGKDRMDAMEWLASKEFKGPGGSGYVQPPYQVTDIQAEYLCESEKNAKNLMTDVFFSFSSEQKDLEKKISKALMHYGITSWTHDVDIKKGADFNKALLKAVEQADNVVYLISKESFESQYCREELLYAIKLNKRILPCLIDDAPNQYDFIPKEISHIQYIDFTCALTPEGFLIPKGMENRREKSPFDTKVAALYAQLIVERAYYNLHKVFLVQALRWETQNKNESILLRGFSLENAKSWLELGALQDHKPLPMHSDFIKASETHALLQLSLDVFVSYSRTDSEIAREINENLQLSGKTTWFDQESIASGADFQKEIFKGIENSNNFLFLISPDAVNSVFCNEEVEYADKLGKRFVTALIQETPVEKIHPLLANVQWIDFEKKDFSIAFGELNRTLHTDREHVKEHTKWTLRSMEWDSKDRSGDLLLKGTEFILAQNWMQEADEKAKNPKPTQLQRAYIDAADKAIIAFNKREARRVAMLRTLLMAALVFLVFAVIAAFVAFGAKIVADEQRELAKKNEKEALIQKAKAEEQQKIAELERIKAKEEERKAKVAEREAIKQKVEAERQKTLADIAKEKAIQEEKKARITEKDAIAQKLEAQKQKLIADTAKIRAQEAKDRAMFQLYLFNAKEFANKSIFNRTDNKLKALLALTAYQLKMKSVQISEKSGYPMENDPEILEALQHSYLTYRRNSLYSGETWAMTASPNGLAFSPKHGSLLLANINKNPDPELPSLAAPQNIIEQIVNLNNAAFRCVAYSAKNDLVVAGTADGNLIICSISQKTQTTRNIESKSIISLQFIEGSSLLIAEFYDSKVIVFDYSKQQVVSNGSLDEIKSLAKVTAGKWIALDLNGNLLYCTLTGQNFEVKTKLTEKKQFRIISSNPAMKLLVACTNSGEGFIYNFDPEKVEDLKTFKPVLLPNKHYGIVSAVSFSQDNRWLVTGSLDGTISLWDFYKIKMTGIDKMVPIVINNKKQIFSLSFDSESKYLLFGDNSSLHIYPLDAESIYNNLKKLMNGENLSNAQWNYFKRGELDKPE